MFAWSIDNIHLKGSSFTHDQVVPNCGTQNKSFFVECR